MTGRPEEWRLPADSALCQLDKDAPVPECFLKDSSVQLGTQRAARCLQLSHSRNRDTGNHTQSVLQIWYHIIYIKNYIHKKIKFLRQLNFPKEIKRAYEFQTLFF